MSDTCGVAVELIKGVPVARPQVRPRQPLQRQARSGNLLALLPYVLALALPQRRQKVLEGFVAPVFPARRVA